MEAGQNGIGMEIPSWAGKTSRVGDMKQRMALAVAALPPPDREAVAMLVAALQELVRRFGPISRLAILAMAAEILDKED